MLSRSGYEAILAVDGEDGLSLFHEHQHKIELVLSDLSMPKMDGLQMVRSVLQKKSDANIILMTGYSSKILLPEDLNRLCSVLPKPFTATSLVEAVEKCLKYERQKVASGA